mgnify:CR=1 FL=1
MSSKQIRSGAKAPGHRRHIVGRLMGYIKRGYKARFIIVLVCILVSAIANVAGSLFLGSLIDDYITPLLGAADPDFSGLVRALVMMGCLFLVGALCAYAYNRNMIVVSQGVQKTIRDDLFGHMQTLPIKYFDTHAHGDVMSVYTNDVDTLRQMFAQSIPQVINSSMTILVTFLGMLFTNALLTVVVLVCVCFALVVTRFLAGRSGRYFLRQQSTLGALNGYIEEMINGQKVVKVFCHEQEAQDGFDRVNDEMFHSADKAHTYASILMPIMVNIGNVQYVIVAMVGGALALSGVDTTITLGVIASFLQLSKSFSNPINQISQQFNSIIMALAGAERIFALMDEEPEEDDDYDPRAERIAGESHYPLKKMIALAVDGITSLSVKPLQFITGFGIIVALISFIGCIWALITALCGKAVAGWASMTCIVCFVSGVQLICLGIIGEYIGKIYMETKHRPRYIISERTWEKSEE